LNLHDLDIIRFIYTMLKLSATSWFLLVQWIRFQVASETSRSSLVVNHIWE